MGTAVALAVLGQQPSLANTPAPAAASRSRVVYDSYILGPGDTLQIELLDIPELGGTFSIGPDGTLYLPRLRALYVEGLTVEELRYFLTEQFKPYVRQPEVYIRPVTFRPVRVYVGGEIQRPGYYVLSGLQKGEDNLAIQAPQDTSSQFEGRQIAGTRQRRQILPPPDLTNLPGVQDATNLRVPTLFDALRAAQGVTSYSDLGNVQVTRKRPVSLGGGKVRANVNFIQLITEGDESQNIRLFDGDVVAVAKSPIVLQEQLIMASQTNLSPAFLEVFLSGRVKEPGAQRLLQGASLNQAIASAGGPQLLRGKVEFIRLSRANENDKRLFSYNPKAPAGDFANPILMSGDIIRINESGLSAGISVFNELTGPLVGIYSVYSLFGG